MGAPKSVEQGANYSEGLIRYPHGSKAGYNRKVALCPTKKTHKHLHICKNCCTFAVANEFTMEDNFAIQLFEGKKVRIVWDEEQEKYYFSVVDIVQVLTGSVDARTY